MPPPFGKIRTSAIKHIQGVLEPKPLPPLKPVGTEIKNPFGGGSRRKHRGKKRKNRKTRRT